MMHLQYFLDAANDPALTALYAPWIGYQARAITNNAQAGSGDVGNVWAPGGTEMYGPEILGMAISAGNIASKVYPVFLFVLAKGIVEPCLPIVRYHKRDFHLLEVPDD